MGTGVLHDATHTYKYSFGLAGIFYVIGVVLLVAVRIKNDFVQRKNRKRAALLKPNTAKTITSILSMARQNASNISLDKYGPSEIIRVPSTNILANNRKDLSHSNSGELAPLHPVWIAGGDDGSTVEVPRLELIQASSSLEIGQSCMFLQDKRFLLPSPTHLGPQGPQLVLSPSWF